MVSFHGVRQRDVHPPRARLVRNHDPLMIWRLVERYTFTGENGEMPGGPRVADTVRISCVHPNYEIIPDTLDRRGVATALQATEFPG